MHWRRLAKSSLSWRTRSRTRAATARVDDFFCSLVVMDCESARMCGEEEDRNAAKASFLSRRRERL